jgi:hypothetical protein
LAQAGRPVEVAAVPAAFDRRSDAAGRARKV